MFNLHNNFVKEAIGRTKKKIVYDDNFIDRLNHHYTVVFLTICIAVISTKTYVGKPITCFCPNDFTDERVNYANYVCWVSNTYYIPFAKTIPPQYSARIRDNNEITYYQYVPLYLFITAFVMKLPRFLWKMGVNMSGLGLNNILLFVHITQMDTSERKQTILRDIARFVTRWTASTGKYRAGIFSMARENLGEHCFFGCGRHYGNYLVSVCLLSRLFYFVISVLMLVFINDFVGNDFHYFGYGAINAFFNGDEWVTSPRFPRVTLCDFELRQMTNVQRWTLQCILPVNLYNEMIFITLWFWYTLLACLNLVNFGYSFFSAVWPINQESFACKYLMVNGLHRQESVEYFPKLVNRFIRKFLRPDGIFLLKLISANSKTLGVSDLMKYMWEDFMNTNMRRNGVRRHSNESLARDMNDNSDAEIRPLNGSYIHDRL